MSSSMTPRVYSSTLAEIRAETATTLMSPRASRQEHRHGLASAPPLVMTLVPISKVSARFGLPKLHLMLAGELTNVTGAAIVISVSGVYFMNSFFNGALAVSLPTIQKDLNISPGNLQWSASTYALSNGSFLLIFGRLADIYSPRFLFLSGTAFYAALSIAIALAPSWQPFTALCCLLGLGAAANTPSGVGVLGRYFEPGEAKNRAFACLGAGQPMGYLFGLVIGALLTKTPLAWRASFYMQSGLSILFLAIGWLAIPSRFPTSSASIPLAPVDPVDGNIKEIPIDSADNKKLDWIGGALSVSGLTLLVFSISDAAAEPKGWSTPFIPPLLVVSVLLLAAFHLWTVRQDRLLSRYNSKPKSERSTTRPPAPPLLTPRIWQAPHVAAMMAVQFWALGSFNTSSFFVNLMNLVVKATPLQTALYFLPLIGSGIVFNLIPGFLLSKVKAEFMIFAGVILTVVAPVLMAVMDTKASYWHWLFAIFVFSPAPDLLYAVITVQLSRSVPRSQQAAAGALFNVVSRITTAVSLAVISTASTEQSARFASKHGVSTESVDALMSGYRLASWLCAAWAGISVVIAVVHLRGLGIVGRKEE